MKRVVTSLTIITLLEIWALFVFRGHPLVRPEWYSTLLLAIQLLMGVGGVHACRWLLRQSALSKLSGPSRDWTKLWLWCGPVGGILLVLACLTGKLFSGYFNSLLIGWLVTAHIAGGAVVWVVALPWAISDLFRDQSIGFRERVLMQVGIAAHVFGLATYFGFFPGKDLQPVSILAAVYFFGSILYYLIAVAVSWGVIFKFWQPRIAPNQADEETLSPR